MLTCDLRGRQTGTAGVMMGILTTRAALQPRHASVQQQVPPSHTLLPPTGARVEGNAGLSVTDADPSVPDQPADPDASGNWDAELGREHPDAGTLVQGQADALKGSQRFDEDVAEEGLNVLVTQPRELAAQSLHASPPGSLSRIVRWRGAGGEGGNYFQH